MKYYSTIKALLLSVKKTSGNDSYDASRLASNLQEEFGKKLREQLDIDADEEKAMFDAMFYRDVDQYKAWYDGAEQRARKASEDAKKLREMLRKAIHSLEYHLRSDAKANGFNTVDLLCTCEAEIINPAKELLKPTSAN